MTTLDVGPGRFWLHEVPIRPGVEVIVTAQLRETGEVETILLVTVDDDGGLRRLVSDLPAGGPPLRTLMPTRYGDGVWQRVPGALKRPVRAVWYRQLHDERPSELVVDLPALDILERSLVLPEELPGEQRVDGWGTTSGLLRATQATLLRLSVPEPLEPTLGPAFRVNSAAADLLGILHFNGPSGWLDAIAVFSTEHAPAATEALRLEVVPG